MEVTVLKGQTGAIRHFAEHVIAERGVRHGQLVIVPEAVAAETGGHHG
jgi:CopG family nickel-responsive transcriptional regulator